MNNFLLLLTSLKLKIQSYLSKPQAIHILTDKNPTKEKYYLAVDFTSGRITPYWCHTIDQALHNMGPALKGVNYAHLRKYKRIIKTYSITTHPELFI